MGSLKPNDLGLFDMHGNTWEWCQNIHKPYAIGEKATEDIDNSFVVNNKAVRVLRGGTFASRATQRALGLPSQLRADGPVSLPQFSSGEDGFSLTALLEVHFIRRTVDYVAPITVSTADRASSKSGSAVDTVAHVVDPTDTR